MSLEIPRLSRLQKLEMALFSRVRIGRFTKPGWSGYLPFYAFKCACGRVHVDYPHGWNEHLSCPLENQA